MSYFSGKRCDICKKQATRFRLILNRQYMLCDGKECELRTRLGTPFFVGYPISEKEAV